MPHSGGMTLSRIALGSLHFAEFEGKTEVTYASSSLPAKCVRVVMLVVKLYR